MAKPDRPLIVVADDDDHFLRLIEHHLASWSYRVRGVTGKAELLKAVDAERPDLLLMDVRFGEHDGVELLRQLVASHPGLKVVMLTAYGSIDSAISSIRLGAADYLSKPVDLARLRTVVNHALDDRTAPPAARPATPAAAQPPSSSPTPTLSRPILGGSQATRQLRDRIAAVAPTDATVLILGESGSGKELVARAIHELSPRRGAPFIPLNVAALPRELVESTLFGHEKGAFTGADQAQRGCCEAADTGTLFLDEIGEMEVSLQAKLLRFLQERQFNRVGSSKLISVDVRIVAATHRDPGEQIRRGQLREDLYYRLNVVPITVPALRQRRDDVPDLAAHFLRSAGVRHRRGDLRFTDGALQALTRYDWPGNVRQLENLVERLAILTPHPVIDEQAVAAELREAAAASPAAAAPVVPPAPAEGEADDGLVPIERLEKQAIIEALKQCQGKVREAARSLGLGQATVYRKIKRYNIPLD